jgi:hypothetical protein
MKKKIYELSLNIFKLNMFITNTLNPHSVYHEGWVWGISDLNIVGSH